VEGAYDAILSPFHDQGLIPLKLIDFNDAVNITLGLPRPRVSPDHGTAFNIAGQGKADPSSTIRAFEVATRVAASIKQLH
jgi:4-hydroxythreonine-4-phosphate dehydrogenase